MFRPHRGLLALLVALALGACNLSDPLESQDLPDAGPDTDPVEDPFNSCGGEVDLFFQNELAEPGDPCGPCDDGTLLCDGPTRLRCSGATSENACGGCGPLFASEGDACGPCGDGAWACSDGGLTCEGASPSNPCGGCADLSGAPGDACTVGDDEAITIQSVEVTSGHLACTSPDDLRCVLPGQNACGGAQDLPGQPGDPCGPCDGGVLACDGDDALTCLDESAGLNECGGCNPLPAAEGDSCGRCGGQYQCDGEELLRCDEPNRNACGGCDDLGGNQPGDVCGQDSLFVCAEDTLTCQEGAQNPCGGTSPLDAAPGDPCGTCGQGYTLCASPEITVCVNDTPTNACGGCAPLPAAPGDPCTDDASFACASPNHLACEAPDLDWDLSLDVVSGFLADGHMIAPIDVTIHHGDTPAVGIIPTVTSSHPDDQIYPCSPTNDAGLSRCGITGSEPGERTLSLTSPTTGPEVELTLLPRFPGFSSPVLAMATTEDMIFFAGGFTSIGEPAGSLLAIDQGLPEPVGPVTGQVWTILPDGDGGYFIGGAITSVAGEPVGRLAHILADGTLNPDFRPQFSGTVRALALHGDHLYVGGQFFQANTTPRRGLAVIHRHTGQLQSFDAQLNGSVNDLQIHNGLLFVGGSFTSFMDEDRERLAQVQLSNQTLTNWSPSVSGLVNALAIHGGRVYVGGSFLNANDTSNPRLAAFALSNGSLIDFAPNPSGTVNALIIHDGALYVGGSFTSIGNEDIARLARFNASTGSLDTTLSHEFSSTIFSISTAGEDLLVGGIFTTVDDQDLPYVVARHPDGSLSEVTPRLNGGVYAIHSGDDLLIGGSFNLHSAIPRSRFAAFDRHTHELLDFEIAFSSTVFGLHLSDQTLRAIGWFNQVNGEPQPYLARYDLVDHTLAPGISLDIDGQWGGWLNSLHLGVDSVYLVGEFDTVNSVPRFGVASLDLHGNLTDWNPNPPMPDVDWIDILGVFEVGDFVVLDGYFSHFAGQEINDSTVVVDRETGELLLPNAEDDLPGWLHSGAMANGVPYFFGHGFIDGTTYRAFYYDEDDGMLPLPIAFDSTVSWAHGHDDLLLLGGSFEEVDGQTRTRIAALTQDDFTLQPWSPTVDHAISRAFSHGPLLLVSGNLQVINGHHTQRFGAIPKPGYYP